MKKMTYVNKSRRKWLDHREYRGYEYVIMSLGTHPTAYVGIPVDEYEESMEDEINVHGGISYSAPGIIMEDMSRYHNNKMWLGWGYFLDFDYTWGDDVDKKKWTTKEILGDVKSVINQIIERPGKRK